MLQLLLFSGLAFFLCLQLMKRTLTISLDWDWFWRKFLDRLAREFAVHGSVAHSSAMEDIEKGVQRLIARLYRHHGPHGALAKSWPTGSTALWVAVMLGFLLLVYYI
jgi:multicomponent Na+:H+ antiporter subunit D